jgi:hypothetical protein
VPGVTIRDMRLALMLVVGLLGGCAAGQVRHAPRDHPMNEAATFGPSHTVYVR